MSQEKGKENGLSRREFARGAVLGVATATCLPRELLAQSVTPVSPDLSQPRGTNSQQHAKLSPAGQAEVEEKIQSIFRKYGERLSEAQKTDIRRLVTEGQAPLEKMRAFPLDNSDQPGNVMKLFPDATETRHLR